ncbi:MAG: hypothetical protein ABSH50_17805 [Bryobacteraceae bacterium]|jgi:hypothetical protein
MAGRGKLLFKAPSIGTRSRYFWAIWAFVMALLFVESWALHRSTNWLGICFFMAYGVVFSLSRRAGIYESGIRLPARFDSRGRFIPWSQIERFHWDGDILAIQFSATLAGTNFGNPLNGGAIRVPDDQRAQVEQLLAQSKTRAGNS